MLATITQSRLFGSLPEPIQKGIQFYADKTGLGPFAVITFAFSSQIGLDPVFADTPSLRPGDLLSELPVNLEQQVREFMTWDPGMTVNDEVELAIAGLLDLDASGYDDCLWPNRESLDLLLSAVPVAA